MKVLERTLLVIILLFVVEFSTLTDAGVPEPGLTMYGTILNTSAGRTVVLTTPSLNLIWRITPQGLSPVPLTRALSNINDEFSYVLKLPFETVVTGFPVNTSTTFELISGGRNYERQCVTAPCYSINSGVWLQSISPANKGSIMEPATIIFSFSGADRGKVERVDLHFGINFPDTNSNGLPDYWEDYYTQQYPTCSNLDNPNDDSDGDGFTNAEEYWSGTDPCYPDSFPTAPRTPVNLTPVSPSEVNTATPLLTVTNSSSQGYHQQRYQVAQDDEFATGLVSGAQEKGSITTSWTVSETLVENTVHYWRCRTEDINSGLNSDWTEPWRFFVNAVNDPPYPPIPTIPADNGRVSVYYPTLTVINASDPDDNEVMDYPLTYAFTVYSNPLLTVEVDTQSGVLEGSGTTSSAVGTELEENTEYWWRTRGHDGVQFGEWSTSRSFFVSAVNEVPGAPTLHSPLEASDIDVPSPDLIVTNANDPDRDPTLIYTIELYDDPALTNLVAHANDVIGGCCSGTTTWSVSVELEASRWHWWRSRVFDGQYTGPYMATASFFSKGFPLPEPGEYGYLATPGGDTTRGDRISYTFPPASGDITILYQVYNIPLGYEDSFRILINGQDVGNQGVDIEDDWSDTRVVVLPEMHVLDDTENVLVFTNEENGPGSPTFEWGLRYVGVDIQPPSPISAIAYNTTVDIRWQKIPGVSGYSLYRSTQSGGPYSRINATKLTGNHYRDTGLINEVTYYYVMRSVVGEELEGYNSNEVSATPSVTHGVTPVTDLTVSKSGDDILLEWTVPTTDQGIQFFRVYTVDGSSVPPFTRSGAPILHTPIDGWYLHTGVLNNATDYFYDVATVDNSNLEAIE